MTNLLIVESPKKAKLVASFLDDEWRVEASRGHVRDLPNAKLGVDIEQEFRPQWATVPGKHNLVRRLRKVASEAEAVYLATDPDREGEAIAWHIREVLHLTADKPLYRATFTAITENAVKQAIAQPTQLDDALVAAQQTRRVIDRLVGYLVSPLACKALDGSFSAGRVQSVGLRLIVERERAIAAFEPQTYWTLGLRLLVDDAPFTAKLHRIKGGGPRFSSQAQVKKLAAMLHSATIWVAQVATKDTERQPPAPFTTSTLQQAASKALGFTPERTMQLAQGLYEQGRISYHRTDATQIAPEAQTATQQFITAEYGSDYLPTKPHKASTGAHEGIRPTDITQQVDASDGDAAALYDLIWRRFVASQMAAARYSLRGVLIQAGPTQDKPYPVQFRAQQRSLSFDGFLRIYEEAEEPSEEATDAADLPELQQGQMLALQQVLIDEKQTRPPSRFNDATLVGALEKHGVGRPSTYAGVLQTLRRKQYIRNEKRQLLPTEDGQRLHDFLDSHFPTVFAVGYTAQLEALLDQIAAGEAQRRDVLRDFWREFHARLQAATRATLTSPAADADASKPLVLRPTED